MVLSINIRDKVLICLETTNIRTVSIVNNCVNVSMNSRDGKDGLTIYTDSADECQCIYDRIVYYVNNPISALSSDKDYLRIGCEDREEYAGQ